MVVINYRQASTSPAAGFVIENNIIVKIVIRVAKSPIQSHSERPWDVREFGARSECESPELNGLHCTMRKSYFSSFVCFSFMFESKMDSLICLIYIMFFFDFRKYLDILRIKKISNMDTKYTYRNSNIMKNLNVLIKFINTNFFKKHILM